MGFKSSVISDIVCDSCGEIFINKERSSDNILLNKALNEGWTQDNNGKIYCKKCQDKKFILELKYHWVNYFRMACKEYSIKNTESYKPIQDIRIDDENNRLTVVLLHNDNNDFAQTSATYLINNEKLSKWQQTCSRFELVYPDKKIEFHNLICSEQNWFNEYDEFVFAFDVKNEIIF